MLDILFSMFGTIQCKSHSIQRESQTKSYWIARVFVGARVLVNHRSDSASLSASLLSGSGRSGGKVKRKTQMRNAEGNSGYLANKSRKLEGGIRGGAPTDRQTELKYQQWCGENYFSGTFWTVLLLLLLVVIVVVVLELLVL